MRWFAVAVSVVVGHTEVISHAKFDGKVSSHEAVQVSRSLDEAVEHRTLKEDMDAEFGSDGESDFEVSDKDAAHPTLEFGSDQAALLKTDSKLFCRRRSCYTTTTTTTEWWTEWCSNPMQLPTASAAIDKFYSQDEFNEAGFAAGAATTMLGLPGFGLGIAEMWLKSSEFQKIADSGALKFKLFANGARHLGLGLHAAFGSQSWLSADAQRAELTKELMNKSITHVYENINSMTSSLSKCLGRKVEAFRTELTATELRVQEKMKQQDYRNQFSVRFVISQDRLRSVLLYIADSPELKWLASSVEEGLHTCMDIGSLIPLVSKESIAEVMTSLPYVNEWWSMCTVFLSMAKDLEHHKTAVPFNARFRTEVLLGEQFIHFYDAVKTGLVGSPINSKEVSPYILRVRNFLNLATAVHHHKRHEPELTFPHRQGNASPSLNLSHLANSGGYERQYSKGNDEHFMETCRFCREDGESYGCWEEQALSFERCVHADGIYYNTPLNKSNAFGCSQRRPGTSTWHECGGRPQQ